MGEPTSTTSRIAPRDRSCAPLAPWSPRRSTARRDRRRSSVPSAPSTSSGCNTCTTVTSSPSARAQAHTEARIAFAAAEPSWPTTIQPFAFRLVEESSDPRARPGPSPGARRRWRRCRAQRRRHARGHRRHADRGIRQPGDEIGDGDTGVMILGHDGPDSTKSRMRWRPRPATAAGRPASPCRRSRGVVIRTSSTSKLPARSAATATTRRAKSEPSSGTTTDFGIDSSTMTSSWPFCTTRRRGEGLLFCGTHESVRVES